MSAVREGGAPRRTVREILDWFGYTRRGVHVVASIHGALSEAHLETEPSFETTYLDEEVEIRRSGGPTDDDIVRGGSVTDPIIRVSSVAAAHRQLVTVSRDQPVERAVTLMIENHYSQLPVMPTPGARDVDGMISWRSLGAKRASGSDARTVSDAIEPVEVVDHNADLIQVVERVLARDVVLVRAQNRTFQGILTVHDIATQFQSLAEPFLLVGEIEKQIRRLIDGRYTHQQLADVRHADDEREITTVADLTFGEYVRLVENPDNWARLGLGVDRAEFVRVLRRVNDIRNDVMHFDPDGLDDSVQRELYNAKRLLESVRPEPAPRPV